jgi:hypothetical protein
MGLTLEEHHAICPEITIHRAENPFGYDEAVEILAP